MMILHALKDPSSPPPWMTLKATILTTTGEQRERSVVIRNGLITGIWRRQRERRRRWCWMMADRSSPWPTNTLSVDSSKGRLVIERMDSIRNLFGCELRIVAENDSSDTAVNNASRMTTFAISRLQSEYKALDNQLIDRLKVRIHCYIYYYSCSGLVRYLYSIIMWYSLIYGWLLSIEWLFYQIFEYFIQLTIWLSIL